MRKYIVMNIVEWRNYLFAFDVGVNGHVFLHFDSRRFFKIPIIIVGKPHNFPQSSISVVVPRRYQHHMHGCIEFHASSFLFYTIYGNLLMMNELVTEWVSEQEVHPTSANASVMSFPDAYFLLLYEVSKLPTACSDEFRVGTIVILYLISLIPGNDWVCE